MERALIDDIDSIKRALSGLRLPAAPEEYDIHALVGDALTRAGIAARHEVNLGRGCRIDFLCDGIGIEVKKGKPARAALMHQILRYALSPGMRAIIIIAPGDVRMPKTVGGVPVISMALARLWGVALP